MKDLLGYIKKAQKSVAFYDGFVFEPKSLFESFFAVSSDVVGRPADEMDVLRVRNKVVCNCGAELWIKRFLIRRDLDGVACQIKGFDKDFHLAFFAFFFYNAHTYIIPQRSKGGGSVRRRCLGCQDDFTSRDHIVTVASAVVAAVASVVDVVCIIRVVAKSRAQPPAGGVATVKWPTSA